MCTQHPLAEDGSCDTTIAKQVLQTWIDSLQGRPCDKEYNYNDYLHEFKKTFDLKIVYNPEFLTEANADEDFKNPFFKYLVASGEIVK